MRHIHLVILGVLLSTSAQAEQTVGTLHASAPVAHVNGQPIDAASFNAKVTQLHRRVGKVLPVNLLPLYKKRIIDDLVEQRLLSFIKTKRKVEISEDRIQQWIDKHRKRYKSQEDFERFINKQYGDLATYKKHVKQRLLRAEIILSLTRDKVTVADAKAYYKKKKNKKYLLPEEVRASHILLRVPRGSENKVVLEALRKAEKIAKEAKDPKANFAKLAQKYSEGPSKNKGGDLGYFTQDKMVKSFGKAAFELKIGEVSKPVRSQFGYHVIKVFAKRKAKIQPFKEVKQEILTSLQTSKNRRTYDALLKRYTKNIDVVRHPDAVQIKTK